MAATTNADVLDVENMTGGYPRVWLFTMTAMLWTWIVGAYGLSLIWLALPIFVLWLMWKEQTRLVVAGLASEVNSRLHRQKAFRQAESAEWLNAVVNRWCACNSESIFNMLTAVLNPLLDSMRPPILESIELSEFNLAGRTPYLQDISVMEEPMHASGRDKVRVINEYSAQQPPSTLAVSPSRHNLIINAKLLLQAPDGVLNLKALFKGVGASATIQLGNFNFKAPVQLVLTLDSELPPPSISHVTITFLEKPDVWFSLCILHAVQIMQVPLVKTWLHSLVMDALTVCLVDPAKMEFDLTQRAEEAMAAEEGSHAVGLLTVILSNSPAKSNDQIAAWTSIRLAERKFRTSVRNSHTRWKAAFSFLSHNPADERVLLKVFTRKMMRKTALVERSIELSSFVEESASNEQSSTGKRQTTMTETYDCPSQAGDLSMRLVYTRLPSVDDVGRIYARFLSGNEGSRSSESSLPPSTPPPPPPSCVSGVLYICLHGAENLLAMDDDGTSDPYCVVMANRKKVFTSKFQANTLNPKWEQGFEFLTADYTQTKLTFLLYDWDGRVSGDDFLGLCSLTLTPEDVVLKRKVLKVDLPQGDMLKELYDKGRMNVFAAPKRQLNRLASSFSLSSRLPRQYTEDRKDGFGSLFLSIVFRPVESVELSEKLITAEGQEEVEPLELVNKGGMSMRRLAKTDDSEVGDRVEYGLASDGVIQVQIHQAKDLVARDMNGKSDPYCEVRYEGKVLYRTRTIQGSLQPCWEESFSMAKPKANDRLRFNLFDKDKVFDDDLGYLEIDLAEMKAILDEPRWFKLEGVPKGELQLTINVEEVTASKDPPQKASPKRRMAISTGDSLARPVAASPSDSSSSNRSDLDKPSAASVRRKSFLESSRLGHNRSHSADMTQETKPEKSPRDSPHEGASREDLRAGALVKQAELVRRGSTASGLSANIVDGRRPSTDSGSVRSFGQTPSVLFNVAGAVIRADGLKGDAGSLELYVKVRLNNRFFFERTQPFLRGPQVHKTRRIADTLTPEWRENFKIREVSVPADSLLTIDLKSGKKTTIGTNTVVLEKFLEGRLQMTKWLDMGNGARIEFSISCQHRPPSPTSSDTSTKVSARRSASFRFR